MSLYQNKYRTETIRLNYWDYSKEWWYFVTINTKNHKCYFGDVINGQVILNKIGEVVKEEWLKAEKLRKNVKIDYYVIMPNHLHGIIVLDDETKEISTKNFDFNEMNKRKFFKPIKNSLSVIINQFKGSVKRWCNRNGYSNFEWQPRFFDRIIRNEKELFLIRQYIEQNPLKWEIEKNQPENLDFDLLNT